MQCMTRWQEIEGIGWRSFTTELYPIRFPNCCYMREMKSGYKFHKKLFLYFCFRHEQKYIDVEAKSGGTSRNKPWACFDQQPSGINVERYSVHCKGKESTDGLLTINSFSNIFETSLNQRWNTFVYFAYVSGREYFSDAYASCSVYVPIYVKNFVFDIFHLDEYSSTFFVTVEPLIYFRVCHGTPIKKN